ncbi:MAG: hypothetical protein NUW01_17570 [Gemmatimonadaceae bacterium]|nr:hypothetical protein [Gemmatimonadaceae bacterium]
MSDVEGAVAPTGTDDGAAAPPTPAEPADEPRKIEDDLTGATEAPDEGTEAAEPAELEDDFEEFDWNGKKVKGPKGLKDGVLMHGDYTKKTQEVSEVRKELAAERQRIAEQATASEEELKLRAQHISKTDELEAYKKVDWDAWVQQDPIAAQQGFMRQQTLQSAVNDLAGQLQQRQQQRASEAKQEFAKRMEETQAFVRKNIKGWTPETDKQVIEFAVEQGIELNALQTAMNPTIYKILHLARLGSQVLNTPAATKPPQTPPQPLEVVRGKSNPPAQVSLADADMDRYVAIRKKQIAARG